MKLCSRSKGHSAAGICAYILGERKRDSYTGRIYDHSYRDDIAYREVMLPDYAPRQFSDAQILIDTANAAERRCDARMGRVFDIALPRELRMETNISMIREFAANHFATKGHAAIVAIHTGQHADSRDGEPQGACRDNPHAHLLVLSRPLDQNGFQSTKTVSRSLDQVDILIQWRKDWADLLNRELERHGFRDRMVSHESLARQGIDREPTIHLGASTMRLESRGVCTERGKVYRGIVQRNEERMRQKELARLRQADRERECTRRR